MQTLRPISLVLLAGALVACDAARVPNPSSASPAPADETESAAEMSAARPQAASPRKDVPAIRIVAATCEAQECERGQVLAYDNLPAIDATGDLVALIEERDGWGHVAQVGVHLVSERGAVAFWPTATSGPQGVADANADLARRAMRPLLPFAESTSATLADGKRSVSFVQGDVRVTVLDPRDNEPDAIRFELLVVTQNGREVARRTGASLPDQAGCSSRKMVLEGARGDVRALALTYTNGTTSHACDGVAEPQVHHVVRW